jgi:hypothetical protein
MRQMPLWLILSASLAASSCAAPTPAPVEAVPLLVQVVCLPEDMALELVATDRAVAEAIAANNALVEGECP